MIIFHLGIPTHDLNQSKEFHTKSVEATVGHEYGHYVIFNFFGHQIVPHTNPKGVFKEVTI
jgi:extradiol dioxygenase family protein